MKKDTLSKSYDYCKELLYRLNAHVAIGEDLVGQATAEALNIEDDGDRRYFLSAIFHGLLIKGTTSAQIIAMLEASFSFDDYDPRSRQQLVVDDERPTITIMGSGKKRTEDGKYFHTVCDHGKQLKTNYCDEAVHRGGRVADWIC